MNTKTILKTTLRFEGKQACATMLTRAVVRQRGDLDRIAWEFDISVRHTYRWLMFLGLWPEVEAARKLPPRSAPLARALQEL